MPRPLVICDCDEVLLHMLAPFADWLAADHGIAFNLAGADYSKAMTHADTGAPVEPSEAWRLLWAFFDTEMPRQTPIIGAVAAVETLRAHADVVVLTNLQEQFGEARSVQLAGHGIEVPVFTNQGPKGPALARIVAEYMPSHAVFVDDLPQHLASAAEHLPHTTRLHLCGEPLVAAYANCAHKAGHAHARIDDWATATPWILARLEGETL